MFRKRRPASRTSANAGTIPGSSQFLFVRRLRRVAVLQPLLHLRLQRRKPFFQLLVAQPAHFRFARIDLRDDRLHLLDVAFVLRPDKLRDYAIQYLCCFHK